jgi:hypothetical protein
VADEARPVAEVPAGMRVARVPAAEAEAAVARMQARKVEREAAAVVERVVDEEQAKAQEKEMLEALARMRPSEDADLDAHAVSRTVDFAQLPAWNPAEQEAPLVSKVAPPARAPALAREAEVVEGFEALPGFGDEDAPTVRPRARHHAEPDPTAGATPDAAPAPAPPDLDALYDRLADRLRRELLDDHERRGSLRPPW